MATFSEIGTDFRVVKVGSLMGVARRLTTAQRKPSVTRAFSSRWLNAALQLGGQRL